MHACPPLPTERDLIVYNANLCRYDVKYGSQGFNHFGYLGGCEFALGTYAEAEAAPLAARYLCPPEKELQLECLYDHSGDGICHGQRAVGRLCACAAECHPLRSSALCTRPASPPPAL